jgi:hypothetical protein
LAVPGFHGGPHRCLLGPDSRTARMPPDGERAQAHGTHGTRRVTYGISSPGPAGRGIGRNGRKEAWAKLGISQPGRRGRRGAQDHHRQQWHHRSGLDPESTLTLAGEGLDADGPAQAGLRLMRGSFRGGRRGLTARGGRAALATGPRLFSRMSGAIRTGRGMPCLGPVEVAQPGRVPAAGGGLFGVGRRLDAPLPGPGQALLGAEAAAVPPALLGGAAATRMILTGEGLAAILAGSRGDGQANDHQQIGGQGETGNEPAAESAPGLLPSGPRHGFSRPSLESASTGGPLYAA